MPYLIDGHNLIAQLPDIDIADPYDEAQLVLKLRGFVARTGKKITVIFDGGLPAGTSNTLSTSKITVRFASQKSSADREITTMIQRIRDSSVWILVSSDHEIINRARSSGMQCITAEAFIRELNAPARKKQPPPATRQKNNPQLSKSEIDEWLDLFGVDEDEEDDNNWFRG